MPRVTPSSLAHLEAFSDRRRDPDSKREAVLQTAVRLFLEQGYGRTTLSDVAHQLNITKPALYHYFRSKEEIFLACYRRGSALLEEALACVASSTGNGLEKVSQFIKAYADVIISDFARCFIWPEERELSTEARAEIQGYKRQIDRQLRALVEQGMADGSIRSGDSKLVAFAVAGAVNSICVWYEPAGPLTPRQIAKQFARTLTLGMAREPAHAPVDGKSPHASMLEKTSTLEKTSMLEKTSSREKSFTSARRNKRHAGVHAAKGETG